jgi:acetyl esterase
MSAPRPNYLRFLPLFLRLKLLHHTSRFPPLPGGVLDKQLALLRRAQGALGEIPLDQALPQQARLDFRRSFRTLRSTGGLFEKVHSTRDLDVPGPAGRIPARLYLPDGQGPLPLFVLLHGGGWVIGDLETADNLARFICKRAACAVLSVDYRLAPEHPFPAAVVDAYAAFQWAREHATELGCDPLRVLVGGDSAGGTLSAAIAWLARQNRDPEPAGQVLLYAATDASHLDTPSYQAFGGSSFGLPTQDVEWFLEQYTPDRKDRLNPLVSPLLAKDLRGLAPALVVTAEFDVLRDEAEAYAKRLEEAGVPVVLLRCNGMIHGFLSMAGLIRRATQYFDQVAAEIARLATV